MTTEKPRVSIVQKNLQETPFEYSAKDLTTVKEMVNESLELIGGFKKILNGANTVIIKPNLVEVPVENTGGSVLSDPRVIEATVGLLKEHGAARVPRPEGRSYS